MGGGGAREGLEEDYAGGGLGAGGVETLDAEWHCAERAEGFVRKEVGGENLILVEWRC